MNSTGDCLRDLQDYFVQEWRGGTAPIQRCDVILALLRTGHRDFAELMIGRPITVCPSGMPPRVPKPVARDHKPTVSRVVDKNPCAPSSDAYRRWQYVGVGKTVESLMRRGITQRDIRVWCQRGWMEVA